MRRSTKIAWAVLGAGAAWLLGALAAGPGRRGRPAPADVDEFLGPYTRRSYPKR